MTLPPREPLTLSNPQPVAPFDSSPSRGIRDRALIGAFTSDPHFPYLVSFPRTGSHWLRMLMELYFEKPSLIRTFFYHDSPTFLCYHTHDDHLDLQRENVLYLYRNPVDTVFSGMVHFREPLDDRSLLMQRAGRYALHLRKWLFEERLTRKKTIISYDRLREDFHNEFNRVCEHFETHLNIGRIDGIRQIVTHERVRIKTPHDTQVICTDRHYSRNRNDFKDQWSSLIHETVERHLPENHNLWG